MSGQCHCRCAEAGGILFSSSLKVGTQSAASGVIVNCAASPAWSRVLGAEDRVVQKTDDEVDDPEEELFENAGREGG